MSQGLILFIPLSLVRPHPFPLPASPLGSHLYHVQFGLCPQGH